MAEKTRVNRNGFLEGYDEETGEVIWVEKKKTHFKDGRKRISALVPESPYHHRRPRTSDTHHFVLDGNQQKQWVRKGTNPDHLPRDIYPFSQVTQDNICRMLTEGMSITDISRLEEMPPRWVIWRWRNEHPEFKAAMEDAKKCRAEYFHDEVISIANQEELHEDDVPREKMRADLYKWGAAVGDSDSYGNKTKLTGDPGNPAIIMIETGIRREGDEPISVENTALPGPELEDKK